MCRGSFLAFVEVSAKLMCESTLIRFSSSIPALIRLPADRQDKDSPPLVEFNERHLDIDKNLIDLISQVGRNSRLSTHLVIS